MGKTSEDLASLWGASHMLGACASAEPEAPKVWGTS